MSQSSAPQQSSLDGKTHWDKARNLFKLEAASKTISTSPTGDDTDNIQTAINTVSEDGGGMVLLKPGTYNVTGDITLKSAVGLRGYKESTTIIDFNGAFSLQFEDSAVYITGTISSITGGVNVTGSGTLWLANATAGQYLFLQNRHYKIAAVTSDTTLILSEGYIGNATLPGATYRISTILTDIDLAELTVKDSSDDGLYLRGAKNITLENMTFLDNNVGIDFDNVTEFKIDNSLVVSSTSDGIQMNDCGFGDIRALASASNGADGFNLGSLETVPFSFCSATSNTSQGVVFGGTKCLLIFEARANGSEGILLSSGASNNLIQSCLCISNTTDGLELNSNNDRNIVSNCIFNANGGYGVTINASTCDKNLIHGNQFSGNSSGTIFDAGTGTSSVDNVT